MAISRLFCAAAVAAFVGVPSVIHAQVQITPVVSGLTQPVFVGHASDGTNRLFILERPGRVLVLPPGGSMGIVFLDITAKVLTTGSEQGLLGLAFHPQYASNRRFFAFYTRRPDGAIQISEFRATADPNMADPTELPLLTIPHPGATNHNGGMLAFGADGYLYIGVGDGGSANDPPNNAQNLDALLGKILRIDVNTASGYLIPPTNPFQGATPGRDEIFAFGMRNPWRFSVDRSTGQVWVGDVGQGLREEVDSPIVNGGNYGWRVFEGTNCTNLGPAACNPANYISPVIEYAHAGGRCSVTGGYVYRGSLGTFAAGTYLYGDYCTGEIFTSVGGTQSVLSDTTMTISSFGEDQQGELYVVNYSGGAISRLTAPQPPPPPPPCTYSISPTQASFGRAAATGSVSVTTGAGCQWTATSNASWIAVTSGTPGIGNGAVTYSVAPYTDKPKRRTGTITVAGRTFSVTQSK